jgi:HAD superfamily hydrolase (TIGR01509 family)
MIIFDCDGVLVDSEIISSSVDAELLTGLGYPITPGQIVRRFVGMTKHAAWTEIAGELGIAFPQDLYQRGNDIILARYSKELRAIEGVAEAIRAIGGARAVASSSEPAKLHLALTLTRLMPLFEGAVFSASQVAQGKPAPDVFLFAAAQCKVAPNECIVVEDSPAGVRAARAAGMRVIGFTGGSHCLPGHEDQLLLQGAAVIVSHMRDLPGAVADLG